MLRATNVNVRPNNKRKINNNKEKYVMMESLTNQYGSKPNPQPRKDVQSVRFVVWLWEGLTIR